MKMTRKVLAMLIAALMLLVMLPVGAIAETIRPSEIISGTCGDDLTWTLDADTGELTVSGTGDMYDYDLDYAPWYENNSNITSVSLSEGVTSIGNYAFDDCDSITYACVPDSVTVIGNHAFSRCYSLAEITVGSGVESIGDGAFVSCYNLTSISLPDGVTSIGESAFRYCYSLTSINIPYGVTGIGRDTFNTCRKLTSVTIPETVTNIGLDAFKYCYALTSVTIPNSVTSVESGAFSYCSALTSVSLGSGLKQIWSRAFAYCTSLASVNIPEGITTISDEAFLGCSSLSYATIPASVTYIGYKPFDYCSSLTEISVDPNNACYCSIDGVIFDKDVKTLFDFPCGKSGDYEIPAGVTSIEVAAFKANTLLTAVTIPSTVNGIGRIAFSGCRSLASATFLGAPPEQFSTQVFNNCAADFCICYTAAHASEWAPNGETEWNGYPIQMISNPVMIGDVDGDGEVTFSDVGSINLTLLNGSDFTDEFLITADIDGDGEVTFADITALYLRLLG